MPEPTNPPCVACDGPLTCRDCNDTRPAAEDVYPRWRLRTPFGRWETVTKVHQSGQYGPVLIWTDLTGGHVPWRYSRWKKLDAYQPEHTFPGKPEIRLFEYEWRDGPVYAIATMDTVVPDIVDGSGVLVQATYQRGEGWKVTHWPNPAGDPEVVECDSKAKARAQVRRLAKEYAKHMGGVPVRSRPAR